MYVNVNYDKIFLIKLHYKKMIIKNEKNKKMYNILYSIIIKNYLFIKFLCFGSLLTIC